MKKLLLVLFIGASCFISCSDSNNPSDHFQSINVGDSLFLDNSSGFISFYKKGRIEYRYYGARDRKAPKDTIDFYDVNLMDADYFFQKSTSFIGICTGKDTTVSNPASQDNKYWLTVDVSEELIEWQNSHDREWNNGTKTTGGKEDIGDHFIYVNASEVINKNNDKPYL